MAMRVKKFAFTDKSLAVIPLVDTPGATQIARAYSAPKKVICGVIAIVLGLLIRAKQALEKIDVRQSAADDLSYLVNVSLAIMLDWFIVLETGLMGDVAQFFWGQHPPWAVWAARAFIYGGILWYCDMHRLFIGRWPAVFAPVVTGGRRRNSSAGSEPPSESEDRSFQANVLYMALPRKIAALAQSQRKDQDCDLVPIVREDHTASKLPGVVLREGVNLCKTHRDIYHTLRGQQVCSAMQSLRLGVSGPEGKHYCPSHMGKAAIPPSEAPKVKFEMEPGHPNAPAVGMGNIPGGVSGASVRRMSDEEDLTPHEIASRLTDEYGGDLLSNALRIFHLMGEKASPSGLQGGFGVKYPDSQADTQQAPPGNTPREEAYNFDTPVPPDVPGVHPVTLKGTALPPLQATLRKQGPSLAVKHEPSQIPLGITPPINLFTNVPINPAAGATNSFGTSDAQPPLPEATDSNKLLSAIVYNMDRLANPEVATKPGTSDSIKRNGEIWAFVARYFNNFHVSLCPGVTGKQLALSLKAINDRLRPLYESMDLPCGFSNRFCIGVASFTWGSRAGDPDHILREQDFVSWDPNQFDAYQAPCEWTLEQKTRASAHIEAWRINALNMSKMFAAVYGADHLDERVSAVEDLRAFHIRGPRKYTLAFIRNAWNALDQRTHQRP